MTNLILRPLTVIKNIFLQRCGVVSHGKYCYVTKLRPQHACDLSRWPLKWCHTLGGNWMVNFYNWREAVELGKGGAVHLMVIWANS